LGPLLTLAGFGVGTWGASWQADRSRRIKNRTSARALRADLRRILGELGEDEGSAFFGTLAGRPSPPTIHPWVASRITDLADDNERLIPIFMELDRDLANLGGAVERYWRVQAELSKRQQAVRELEDKPRAPDGSDVGERMVEEWNATNAERVAEQAIGKAKFITRASHKRAVERIDELLLMLGAIADRNIDRLPVVSNAERWDVP
jgi:hypothetical protein